ncbi:MAG: AAA family ATPase [Rhodopila sp.]|nr:AAA family ATPase [Rhodopila sp.]
MTLTDTAEDRIRAVGGRTETSQSGHYRQQTEKQQDDRPLECINLNPVGAANLPPRPWAYGTFLQFGQAAALGGVDGSGKGSMAVTIALAMITGLPLLGEKVWRPGPVAIISYEDDDEEWHRRIAAACKYHAIDYELAIRNIHILRRGRRKICIATMGDNGPVFPDGDAIISAVLALGAALLIIDPFNHAHGFPDGNNNALIAQVAGEMNRIANETSCATLVLHHLRKGSSGSIDDLMGATSLRATFRATRILQRMTADEAKALKIENGAWRYSRISGSKGNYAPPADQATWFQLVSVPLGNADRLYPAGDECGVTACWQPPRAFGDLDASILSAIFDQIRRGPGNGEDYRPHRQTKGNWVGNAIIAHSGKSEQHAATIVKQWCENNVLIVEEYKHPRTRQPAQRILLNEMKAAAILAPLGGQNADL